MALEPDPETVLRIAWITSALGFLLAAISLVGELLGGWGDLGEVGMTVGTLLGAIAGFGGMFFGSTRGQVEDVGTQVRSVGRAVEGNGETLEDIEHAPVGEGGMVQELDVIQTELDKQTGVLGEQLAVLTEIRDNG